MGCILGASFKTWVSVEIGRSRSGLIIGISIAFEKIKNFIRKLRASLFGVPDISDKKAFLFENHPGRIGTEFVGNPDGIAIGIMPRAVNYLDSGVSEIKYVAFFGMKMPENIFAVPQIIDVCSGPEL